MFSLCTEGLISRLRKQEEEGKNSPIEQNKKEHQSSYRGESVGVLEATWGCQRDGLDVTGEHLHGRKAGKQIKRDELALGGLILDLWSRAEARAEHRETSQTKLQRGPHKALFDKLLRVSVWRYVRLIVELFGYGVIPAKGRYITNRLNLTEHLSLMKITTSFPSANLSNCGTACSVYFTVRL